MEKMIKNVAIIGERSIRMNRKKILQIIIAFIIFIFIIPLMINWLFKQCSPFEIFVTEWTAGDALSFYGSLVGATLTVFGVYLTIQYSQRNYREDIHNRVLPFLALYSLRSRSHYQMFAPNIQAQNLEQTPDYEEYRLKEIYFILENGKINIRSSLSKEQKQFLIQGGLKYVSNASNSYSLCDTNFVSVPLELENVGNGAAINLRIGLNKCTDKEPVYITPINLKQNALIYVHIFSESPAEKDFGDYNLEFHYNDIYKRHYVQKYGFTIKTEDNKIMAELDFGSQQDIIL